jgi:hypothetical protein
MCRTRGFQNRRIGAPVKRAKTLDPAKAESISEDGAPCQKRYGAGPELAGPGLSR